MNTIGIVEVAALACTAAMCFPRSMRPAGRPAPASLDRSARFHLALVLESAPTHHVWTTGAHSTSVRWLTDTSQLAARTRSVATRWQIKRRGELCNGRVVSDRSKTKHNMSCPRCGTAMNDVVRIEPTLHEPGLIAYECPRCVYVTSVLLEPTTSKGNPPIRKRVNARPLK
jgi:hypothetical protein